MGMLPRYWMFTYVKYINKFDFEISEKANDFFDSEISDKAY